MGLLERISARGRDVEQRYAADQWLTDFLRPSTMAFGGHQYPYGLTTTWDQGRVREITNTLPGYSQALRFCPPAFAAQMVRALVLSQARFTFRNLLSSRTPRRTFGTQALSILENPAPSVTTGELLARMEWHAGLAGNAYVLRRPDRLRVLRPDWVAVLFGSHQEPEDAAQALDGELIGFVYQNGGFYSGYKPQTLLPADVAHWCPLPDPELSHIGMSWITPAVREIQADGLATDHKIQYFRNGATPNMVVRGITAATREQFNEIVDILEQQHTGVANAYKTMYLTAGADATVVGSNLAELDMKAVQGGGETRIAFLSRVPAPLLGIAEGLAGSSLNAGNFGMARRMFADTWVYPTLQDLAGSLADIVKVPSDAELWFDTQDMPILREDAKDAADIQQVKIAAIAAAITAGFDPDASVAALAPELVGVLKHTGMVSVQLQQPGAGQAPDGTSSPPTDGGVGPKASGPAGRGATRSWDEIDDDELDEDCQALLAALEELDGDESRAFDESKHLRNPKGTPGGGKFRSMVDRLKDAIIQHAKGDGQGHPFDGFDREQLRRVAKTRGITLKRGASRDDIAQALLDDLHKGDGPPSVEKVAKKVTPTKKAAPHVQHPAEPPAVAKHDSARVEHLKKRLAEIDAEAKPIADAHAKFLQNRNPTDNATLDDQRGSTRLHKLSQEASGHARELLDLLVAREGAPWGGDAEHDADRWKPIVGIGTTGRGGSASNFSSITKLRDRYVVDDRNTIIQNASLRSGSPTPAAKSWAARMRRMVRSAELSNDSTLYRGAVFRPDQILQLRPGTVIHDAGIVSTGTTADESNRYASVRHHRTPGTIRTLFEIRAPKGTSATSVGYGEVVLDHGNQFRIISTRIDGDGVVHVVMELTGSPA